MEPVSSLAILVGALAVKVVTDFAANIENRVFNAFIDTLVKRQQPILTGLEYLQRGQIDLLAGQQKIRKDQVKQIEMFYKNGEDFLTDAKIAVKIEQKKQKLQEAIEAFTSAKNIEEGTNAAKAALFVGACYHLLYCIDLTNGTTLEERWYDDAFHIAEQSRGSDGKPPRELIRELLGLPYLSWKHGTFEVYWKKWEPKLIEAPKVVEAPKVGGAQAYLRAAKAAREVHQSTFGSYNQKCVGCGKDFYVPSTQFPKPLYCPECSPKRDRTRITVKPLGRYRRTPSIPNISVGYTKKCMVCGKDFYATSRDIQLLCPKCVNAIK